MPFIKKIHFKKFKGFENLTINFEEDKKEPKIIAFVGENGSGKSSAFEAMILLKEALISGNLTAYELNTSNNELKDSNNWQPMTDWFTKTNEKGSYHHKTHSKSNYHYQKDANDENLSDTKEHTFSKSLTNADIRVFLEKSKDKTNSSQQVFENEIKEKLNEETEKFKIFFEINKEFNSECIYFLTAYRSKQLDSSIYEEKGEKIYDKNRPLNSAEEQKQMNKMIQKWDVNMNYETRNENDTYPKIKKKYTEAISSFMKKVVNIEVNNINDQRKKPGATFKKGDSKQINFENLSAGEKEIFELGLDAIFLKEEWNRKHNSAENNKKLIYLIDEPELHINTKIQKTFLKEFSNLLPNNFQLWIATHSIGFVRAIQKDLKDESLIINFSEQNHQKNEEKILNPMKFGYRNFQNLFETCLDDLAQLTLPDKLIICEGKAKPDDKKDERGIDAIIYQTIFGEKYPNVLFISGESASETKCYEKTLGNLIPKITKKMPTLRLIDRDKNNENKAKEKVRVLKRYDVESYLFDFKVLENFIKPEVLKEAKNKHKEITGDINEKQKDKRGSIFAFLSKYGKKEFSNFFACKEKDRHENNLEKKYTKLAKQIKETGNTKHIYEELELIIFGDKENKQ